MQDNNKKLLKFKRTIGKLIKETRLTKTNYSINQLAFEYDIDRGNLSKMERGFYDCRMSTAWKLAEALGIKFSEFAKMLEDELGTDFKLMDE